MESVSPREGQRSISLSLTANYAPSWKTWEGIREFVQNWHDGVFSSLESVETFGKTRVDFRKDGANYHAVVGSSGGASTIKLGSVVYSSQSKSLTMTNCSTALKRKVLLLGYSEKAKHHDVIGQFGEGLKVGALALLRSGREVAMLTSQDSWRFILAKDPMFGENVLTVSVSDRSDPQQELSDVTPACPVSISEGDTCVQIWPVQEQEWRSMAKKFLFLEAPADCVHTELGTLLLDKHLQGQLFVKQVWVSDQSKDRLSVGVNFKELRIDRDRRAVIHQSDIDHQVSSMWVRALRLKPDLAPKYFELLEQNSSADVRHASYYLDDASTASLLATEFFRQYGDSAIPLLNTVASETIHLIGTELEEKVILCNQSLIAILMRSGRVRSIDSIMRQRKSNLRDRVPLSSLSPEQLSVFGHAVELVKLAIPEFTAANVDVYQGSDNTVTVAGDMFEVPIWMVDREQVHAKAPCRCTTENQQACSCAAAFLCERIVSTALTSSRSMKEDRLIHHVIAALMSQVCGEEKPFCHKLHQPTIEVGYTIMECREVELLKKMDTMKTELEQLEKGHREDLILLKHKVTTLETQLASEEVKFVDMEQALIESFRKDQTRKALSYEVERKANQEKFDGLYSEFLSASSELQQCRRQLSELEEQLSEERQRHARHSQALRLQCESYLKRLADRIDTLSELQCAGAGSDSRDPQLARLLDSIAREFEDDQKRDLCLVCASSQKDCVVLPCRHHHTCHTCAELLPRCPVCRTAIQQRLEIFK